MKKYVKLLLVEIISADDHTDMEKGIQMTDVLVRYRAVKYPLPTEMKSWYLYGAGIENLGKNGQPTADMVPHCAADELLVRCDATGLCFSDIKIINQGGDHVRIKRDIAVEPVIMGHECVVTVVQVGEELIGQYEIGQRFVVQADIYVNGVGKAYGYALPGALTQYETMGQDVLNGDEGCYLIPVQDETGYAQAALTEPWACVVHSYVLDYRQSIKQNGICLMIAGDNAEKLQIGTTFANATPARIIAVNLPSALLAEVKTSGAEIVEITCNGCCAGIDKLVQEHTAGAGFDDIIVCGKIVDSCLEQLTSRLAHGGIMNIACDQPMANKVSIDVGRVHYDGWYYIGTASGNIGEAYGSHRNPSELKAGGSAWFLGAGGPMGQMHVQRACEMPDGPSLIVASDIDPERLQELRERFIPAASAHDRQLLVLNPKEYTADEFENKLRAITGGNGFDDVVALVPVGMLVEQAATLCAADGLLNIFAGLVRGTQAMLSLDDVYLRNVRWIGASGSKISDMRETLRLAESGALLTANAVAAIGGLNAVYQGLEMVKAQAVPGKIVIYQQIEDLPLLRLHEIADLYPTVAAKLRDGKYWTRDAEDELLRLKLSLPAEN